VGEKAKAAAELENVERVLAAARAKLTGEEWGLAWADWDKMWRKLKAEAAQGKRPATSPKGDR